MNILILLISNSLLTRLCGESRGQLGQRQQEILLGGYGQLCGPQQLLVYIDDILFGRAAEVVWKLNIIDDKLCEDESTDCDETFQIYDSETRIRFKLRFALNV